MTLTEEQSLVSNQLQKLLIEMSLIHGVRQINKWNGIKISLDKSFFIDIPVYIKVIIKGLNIQCVLIYPQSFRFEPVSELRVRSCIFTFFFLAHRSDI